MTYHSSRLATVIVWVVGILIAVAILHGFVTSSRPPAPGQEPAAPVCAYC